MPFDDVGHEIRIINIDSPLTLTKVRGRAMGSDTFHVDLTARMADSFRASRNDRRAYASSAGPPSHDGLVDDRNAQVGSCVDEVSPAFSH